MNTLTSFFVGVITFFSGLFGHTETVHVPEYHHVNHRQVSEVIGSPSPNKLLETNSVVIATSGIVTSTESVDAVTKALADKVIPTLNNDLGLTIKDVDKNGVRDDIDSLISRTYTAPAERRAATQYAQAMQKMVSANGNVSLAVPSIFMDVTHSVDCAFAQMGPSKSAQMIAEIRSTTANTKDRFMAYSKTNVAFSGQHPIVTDDDQKTFCK